MADALAFIARVAPHAQATASATGWLPSVQIAQLGLESAWGTSDLAVNAHNLGGIKWTRVAPRGTTNRGGFAAYPSESAFWEDYQRVQQLGFYDPVRAASGAGAQVAALADSPYDAGHYGGNGAELLSVIQEYNLTRFDPGYVAAVANGQLSVSGPSIAAIGSSAAVLAAVIAAVAALARRT